MTAYGWIFMLASWAIIIGLAAFCFWRTFQPVRKSRQADAPVPEKSVLGG
ncbi:MAG: hypothetical protein LLG01_06220 [Planctomycetaceae bacterium]|nr:hypothetical protein [Planctomycetaceae bacterium]